MLSTYRVLDLTDDRGYLAGLTLAQLGVEVIHLEPPGGHRHRHAPPYAGGEVDPDRAIAHLAYDRGKSSVVIEDPRDLERLAMGADALIECGAMPVDLARLRELNPALVTASITPFGQDGPKAEWAATDLTIAAASGMMSITGDRDRPPVRITVPQTWHYAAADAMCGVLVALQERARSGRGQHVDVSAQTSFLTASQFQMMHALTGPGDESGNRLAGGVELGPYILQFVHACADGHCHVLFLFGPVIGPYTNRLMSWMWEEGFGSQEFAEKNWVDYAMAIFTGAETTDAMFDGVTAIREFVATKTKAELLAASLEKDLLIAPIFGAKELLEFEQLEFRDYWDHIEGIRMPGPPALLSRTPIGRLPRAHDLGTDTERLLAEPRRRPAIMAVESTGNHLPLEGTKVLDFMWALAGPGMTRTLADFGATVIRVDSEHRPDVLRGGAPFIGEDGDPEGALQYHSPNAGKLGLSLNMSTPEAREMVRDLVRWADVVTESFAAGSMVRWDLGYEELREINPSLIMVSSCLMGQTGPVASYAGFGTMAAAIAGFFPITGWPDRPPAGPFSAFTDYISPRFTMAVLLAAIDHRQRTGEGQHIDFSQLQASLHLLSDTLADQEFNNHSIERIGNDDPHMSPHGVYPASGDDQWVAVACESDDHWRVLAPVIGADELSELSTAERLDRRAELDERVSGWTITLDKGDAQKRLQDLGIPAHQVQRSSDCVADPQLAHREMFVEVPHPNFEHTYAENVPFRLSRTPGRPRWGGPTFGQHNYEILTEILGYDGDKVAELVIAGALS